MSEVRGSDEPGGPTRTRSTGAGSEGESAADRRALDESILTAEGLSKTFGSGEERVVAVDDVSFAIERGTVVGLLGPNGAGKTTIVKMLLGLVLPDEGRAVVDGVDVTDRPRDAYRSTSAMLEGARNVYWRLTVRENLRFFRRLAGLPADTDRIDELIDAVGLTERADATVNELSRGMKQKVALACTLAREAPVAFLDEPTLGLDVESSVDLRRQLRRLVDEEDRTVVVSSHDMDVVEAVCDRVIVVNDGRIVVDDAVDELLDVFRTQAYRITVEGELEDEHRSTLVDRFGVDEFTAVGDHYRFDATRVQGDEVYELMDVLQSSPCRLVGIESLEPDLEEIYLSVTGEHVEVDRS